MSRYLGFFVLLLGLFPSKNIHAQSILLPDPQTILHSGENIYFKTAMVRFDGTEETEDGYVIAELERILVDRGLNSSAQNNGGSTLEIVLKRTGGVDPLPRVDEKSGPHSRQYYTVKIEEGTVKITSPSSAGLFYGVQTLRQLISKDIDGLYVPNTKVEDWPQMVYRGFMMDMTHMQFPTIAEIKRQLDFLAQWKVNQYYFYSEANIELDGYPLLMPNARYTKEQIREIIAYAKERFIDVVPNLNLYGHLHDFFKHEHYADLSATPYGWEFKTDHPKVEGIVNDWIEQFSDLFTSPFFHIGYDETYVLKWEAQRIGMPADELYLKMLNRTIKEVERKGKKSLFYADMLQHYPEGISKVEGSPIVVAWHYRPPKEKRYDREIQPFSDCNLSVFLQSATLNYRWLYPDMKLTFENNALLIDAAQRYKAKGFILSGWTDNWNVLMRLSRPDIVHAAMVSWKSSSLSLEDFIESYCNVMYPNSQGNIAVAHLNLIAATRTTAELYGFTSDHLWADPFSKQALSTYRTKKGEIKKVRLLVEEAQVKIRQELSYGRDTATLSAMLTSAKLLDMLVTKHLFAGRMYDLYEENKQSRDKQKFGVLMIDAVNFYSSMAVDMQDLIVESKEMFRKAWLNEYTDYRLGIPMARFDRELQNWLSLQKKLQRLNRSYDANEAFPPMKEYLNLDWD